MKLFINIYPIFINVLLMIFFFFAIFSLYEIFFLKKKESPQIRSFILSTFILVLAFFFSGFYHYHFDYDINDYYDTESLTLKSEKITRIDSFEMVVKEIWNNCNPWMEEQKKLNDSTVTCMSYSNLENLKHLKISSNCFSQLKTKRIYGQFHINKLCTDSTIIFNLGNVHSSDFSNFEDKSHLTTHLLIYNPQGVFEKPFYYKMFIGAVDSIILPDWNYRIEKHWEYVW